MPHDDVPEIKVRQLAEKLKTPDRFIILDVRERIPLCISVTSVVQVFLA